MLFDVKGVKAAVKLAYRRMTFIIHSSEYVDDEGNFKRHHRFKPSHSHSSQDATCICVTADPRFSNPSARLAFSKSSLAARLTRISWTLLQVQSGTW